MSDKIKDAFESFARSHLRREGPFLRKCGLIDSPYTYAVPDIEEAWQDWQRLNRTPDTSAKVDVEAVAKAIKHACDNATPIYVNCPNNNGGGEELEEEDECEGGSWCVFCSGTGKAFNGYAEGKREILQAHAAIAALSIPRSDVVELVRELVNESIDIRLLNDAITLITKSLAGMLTDSSFASPFIEDHRPRTPSWVMTHFRHDYDRRVQYVNDIKQRLDWIRNATEKARKSIAITKAEQWLKNQGE
jgi:hypothetical protein